jgi:O-antigen/teichoic acid export membrane protein
MENTPSDKLFRHSLLLLAAQQVGNLSTMGFQVVMGRTLSAVDYGVLVSLLGIVGIISTPMDSLRMAMAHFSARLEQAGRAGDIRRLLRRWGGYLALLAGPVVLVSVLGAGPLAGFLHLDERRLIVMTGLILAGTLFAPLFLGALQGVQSFVLLSVAGHSWGVVRLLAAGLLVWVAGRTAFWGLTGQLVGVLACVLIGVWGVRRVLGARGERTENALPTVSPYMLRSVLLLAAFAILMFADVVLVRRYLPDQMEWYARASTIGKAIIFFPQPIVGAMFPKVTSAGSTSAGNWVTLGKAVLFAVVCIAGISAFVMLFPQLPLWVMFNEPRPEPDQVLLVRGVVLALSPLAMVHLLMSFEMAQHRFRVVGPLLGCAVLLVGSVVFVHRTVWDVVYAVAAAGTLAAVILVAFLPWRSFGARPSSPNP